MARSGLYKSDVQKARDALLAQGKHPSLDAVRIELGNTGSKSTIHKYLKELETEDGGADGRKASVSEAVQDLAERLASQLHAEAAVAVDDMVAKVAEQARAHQAQMAELQAERDRFSAQLQQTESAWRQETDAHQVSKMALQREAVTRATLEEQTTGLRERLSENEAHRQSLEQKHDHARQALEHYRESVKEQRDQDQRRHEQQIQQLQAEMRQLQQTVVVKQDEVTRLNQEGARLVADLSHAQKTVYDGQTVIRAIEKKLDMLQTVEQRCALLEAQIAARDAAVDDLKVRLADESRQKGEATDQGQSLQVQLAECRAKLDAQQVIAADLRAMLVQQKAPNEVQRTRNIDA
jgi:chromosome segregation ATPase